MQQSPIFPRILYQAGLWFLIVGGFAYLYWWSLPFTTRVVQHFITWPPEGVVSLERYGPLLFLVPLLVYGTDLVLFLYVAERVLHDVWKLCGWTHKEVPCSGDS